MKRKLQLAEDDLSRTEDRLEDMTSRVKELESELEEYKRCVLGNYNNTSTGTL